MAVMSIGIPTFNGARYLSETIDSVLNQNTTCSLQITVVDGGSTDGTQEIVRRCKHQIQFIQGDFANSRNPMVENWMATFRRLGGDYRKLLMQDDVLGPLHLENAVDRLIGLGDAVAAFSMRRIGDPGGAVAEDDSRNGKDDPRGQNKES